MGSRGDITVNQASNTNKKKKNKNKKTGPAPAIKNMNKFVIDTCKRLKERKTYLVWNAVGKMVNWSFTTFSTCKLNIMLKRNHGTRRNTKKSKCKDKTLLVMQNPRVVPKNESKEGRILHINSPVDAIQACGGQMTADGKRHRYGGGILWGILKKLDPNAYKEIMAKGKEIERQFKQQAPKELNPSLQKTAQSSIAGPMINHTSSGSALAPPLNCRAAASNIKRERVSVMNRIRVPVTYDDLLGEEVEGHE
ncbi:uncharacterized protein LOC113294402 [Papaver somniferum]|uniref:uncharacterized protein LOC113294402 n=1 Tax=Papaver somniferum TaxID=3469 RepID=UPI000E7030BE|nr:uncharacterized protein LOC113294402 [Papaver somniferum]